MGNLITTNGFIIPLAPGVLTLMLIGLFLLWIIYSWIVYYHWSRYASKKIHVIQMTLGYVVGSVILWAGILAFYLMYYMNSY